MQEERLIRRARAGDAAAERALYDAHVDRIFRLAYRMAGEPELAEDYTQETFVRAFARLDGFRGEAAFSTWLHRIAVSVILNGLRKVQRHRRREVAAQEAPAAEVASAAGDPALRLRLHRAIESLAEGLKLVFVLHEIEGYKHEEIAGILELPVGTCKSRLARARQTLQEELSRSGLIPAEETNR